MSRRTIALLLIVFSALPPPAVADVRVQVLGVSGPVRENILAGLTIYQQRKEAAPEPRVRRLHRDAEREIRRALEPFGFYRPTVEAQLARVDEEWEASYRVAPGEPIRVRAVDLQVTGEGANDPAFRMHIDSFPLAAGDVLKHGFYDAARTGFEKLAAERGYFDLRVARHELRVDLEDYYADVVLHIATGARYRFGTVTIAQDILDPAFVARYVAIQPGEPYTASALLALQHALTDSDYFSEVEVIAERNAARGLEIPVVVRANARKPEKYTLGAGYGTDTGARAKFAYERRYVNPQGHRVRAEVNTSKIHNSVTAGYFIPIRDPRTDQIAFTGGFTDDDTRTAKSEIARVGVSRTLARGPWRETLALNYQNENFVIGEQVGDSTLLMPGISYTRIFGDTRIYTRRGARATIDTRGASDALVSDTSFVQARLGSKLIHGIFDNGRVILRADAGTTRTSRFADLPASVRFFAGGDQSVRGYGFNALGPTNASGTVVGGKHLLVGSVEYEHAIGADWAAAIFFDAGNALDDFSNPLQRGAGVGVRWKSPVGQIRADVATALSDPERPWRLHLNIGPDL